MAAPPNGLPGSAGLTSLMDTDTEARQSDYPQLAKVLKHLDRSLCMYSIGRP